MTAFVLLALAAGPAISVESGGGPLPKGAVARLGNDGISGHYLVLAKGPAEGARPASRLFSSLAVREAGTGRLARLVAAYPFPMWALSGLSSDFKRLAFLDGNRVVVLEVSTNEVVFRSRPGPRFAGLPALSGRGGFVAIPGKGQDGPVAEVFDVGAKRRVAAVPLPRGASGVALSADGKRLACCGRGVQVFDVKSGKRLKEFDVGGLPAGRAAFSPDGATLAVHSRRAVRLLGLKEGHVARQLTDGAPGYSLEGGLMFSPDGKRVLAWSREAGTAWDASTGKRVAGGHYALGQIDGLSFSPSGVIAAGAQGRAERLWGGAAPALSLAFPAEGAVASTSREGLRLWSLATGKGRQVPQPGGARERDWLLADDGRTALFWSGRGEAPGAWGVLDGRPLTGTASAAHGPHVALSPDSAVAACVRPAPGTRVAFWSPRTGEQFGTAELPKGHSAEARLALSGGGRFLAALSDGGLGHVYNRMRRRWVPLWPLPPSAHGMAFSPDGALLAVSRLEGVTLYHPGTGKAAREVALGRTQMGPVAFSPDGRLLAVAGLFEGGGRQASVVELLSGQTRLVVRGHAGGVTALAFSADGGLLASGGQFGSVLVWDLAGRRLRRAGTAGVRDVEGLSSASAGEAFEAMGKLARSPGRAVELLRARLRPGKAPPTAEKLKELVLLLDEEWAVRRAAEDALWAEGRRALPLLRAARTGSPDLELALRAGRLIGRIERGPAPGRLLEARGVEVLARLGTPEARRHLKELARGHPAAPLTREAGAALRWLEGRR